MHFYTSIQQEDDKLMMQRMWFWVVHFVNLKRMDFCFFISIMSCSNFMVLVFLLSVLSAITFPYSMAVLNGKRKTFFN